jgi:integrase/recombinase XerC
MTKEIRLFIEYLTHQKRLSSHTIIAYQNDLNQFQNHVNDLKVEAVNPNDIRDFLVELIQNGQKARTVSRKLSALRSFYKYLIKTEKAKRNPVDGIQSPKVSKSLPKFVPQNEIQQLMDVLEFDASDDHYQANVILALLYNTGIRRAELIQLEVDDVNMIRKEIKVLGKRSKERLIPITSELAYILNAFISYRSEMSLNHSNLFFTEKGKPLYPKAVYNIVKALLKTTSSKQKSPHVLRHSIATHLLSEGAPLNGIKELLGHQDLSATQIYTHTDIKELQKVHSKIHPRS